MREEDLKVELCSGRMNSDVGANSPQAVIGREEALIFDLPLINLKRLTPTKGFSSGRSHQTSALLLQSVHEAV